MFLGIHTRCNAVFLSGFLEDTWSFIAPRIVLTKIRMRTQDKCRIKDEVQPRLLAPTLWRR